ncbi:MAG TPA: enoyl-CoA hydratase-related protein [Acidimicrobiia bacterium]|nr:enoyl-CoA hydratase-related protein [Acidimicrobiia bacterium]
MWLRSEDRGPTRWLILDRVERKNAVPPQGWDELRDAFSEFESSNQRVLVLTGAGGAFCSGADLDPAARTENGVVANRRRMQRVGEAAMALHRLTKPAVALVDGMAAGAGMNLALGCDLVVATTRARFSEIFVQRGLTVDFGGTWLLPRIVGLQRAKELSLTGRIIDADEALAMGLVLEVIEAAAIDQRMEELTSSLAAGAPVAQMFTKQNLDHSLQYDFAQALAAEGQAQSICLESVDAVEGVNAFIEKRPARFRGR